MAYTDFSLADLEARFGLVNRRQRLFADMSPLPLSATLQEALQQAQQLPLKSEKAKSEWIVAPVLTELLKRNDYFFTIYSGENLSADESKGLKGECDFILARNTGSFDISYPIIQVVEAKKNDLELGVPQCAAQLAGARIFNERKGVVLERLYGCVTTGNEWLFICLDENLKIDTRLYYLNEIGEIVAVFQQIVDSFKSQL